MMTMMRTSTSITITTMTRTMTTTSMSTTMITMRIMTTRSIAAAATTITMTTMREDEHEHHQSTAATAAAAAITTIITCDHDADEVFTSWGVETARKFTKAEVEHALTELDTGNYGMILRSKGIVDGGADGWLEFDYVPGEWEVRAAAPTGGKLVVIGSKLNEKAIAELFRLLRCKKKEKPSIMASKRNSGLPVCGLSGKSGKTKFIQETLRTPTSTPATRPCC